MKRLWAVILTAVVLAGCRSSQPTTNPFMRTTVPPPGTQGMMVMPGEAYPAGTVPPVVTTPGMAPQAVTPVLPVVPGQQAPLISPPPAGPKKEKFQPPGGSFLYHQSSIDSPRSDEAGGVQRASATEPGTARQAVFVEGQGVASSGAAVPESTLKFRPATAQSLGDPPEKLAAVAAAAGHTSSESKIRIVPGSPAAEAAPEAGAFEAGSVKDRTVLRMKAEESRPSVGATVRETSSTAGEPPASRVAFVSQDAAGESRATARFAVDGWSSTGPTTQALAPADRSNPSVSGSR